VHECAAAVEVCQEFNFNVTLKGTAHLPADKKIISETCSALWGLVSKLFLFGYDSSVMEVILGKGLSPQTQYRNAVNMALNPILQTLYRLMLTPSGYRFTVEDPCVLRTLPKIWQIDDTFTLYWSIKCLSALLLPRAFAAERDKETEFVNKSVVFGDQVPGMTRGLVESLLGEDSKGDKTSSTSVSGLIQMVASNTLESILCSHYDTTSPAIFNGFINALTARYDSLMALLHSPASIVMENTALLLHILTKHSPKTSLLVREISLTSGILLQHLYLAIFSSSESQRHLSRYLCSVWISGPDSCAEKQLLKRIVPIGFMCYLKMPLLGQKEEEQLDDLERSGGSEDSLLANNNSTIKSGAGVATNTSRFRNKMRIAISSKSANNALNQGENWRIFFHMLTKNNALPDLIWNQQTRRDLQVALDVEMKSIQRETESRGGIDKIAWNHQQFTVKYPSLKDEVQVGSVYMRLWLQTGDSFIKTWEDPVRLFELLFRRLLCDLDRDVVVANMCIQCLDRLYSLHASKIGIFPDMMILINSMVLTRDIETQHRLLSLIATLLGASKDAEKYGIVDIPGNAEQLLNAESMGHLCQFVAWGHTDKSQVINHLASSVGLLTNTSDSIKDGSKDTHQHQKNNVTDEHYPSVWYVAPAGKIPPSPDTIRGPFRISELIDLMNRNE